MNQNTSTLQQPGLSQALLLDSILISAFSLFIAFSHLIPVPLYLLDPMKVFILIPLLFSRQQHALVIAILLPLISTVISGHPIFPMNILIGIELGTFVILFRHQLLSEPSLNYLQSDRGQL